MQTHHQNGHRLAYARSDVEMVEHLWMHQLLPICYPATILLTCDTAPSGDNCLVENLPFLYSRAACSVARAGAGDTCDYQADSQSMISGHKCERDRREHRRDGSGDPRHGQGHPRTRNRTQKPHAFCVVRDIFERGGVWGGFWNYFGSKVKVPFL